jgi:hypothetical protein
MNDQVFPDEQETKSLEEILEMIEYLQDDWEEENIQEEQ